MPQLEKIEELMKYGQNYVERAMETGLIPDSLATVFRSNQG